MNPNTFPIIKIYRDADHKVLAHKKTVFYNFAIVVQSFNVYHLKALYTENISV